MALPREEQASQTHRRSWLASSGSVVIDMTLGGWRDRFKLTRRAGVSCHQSGLASSGMPCNRNSESNKYGKERRCDFHVQVCEGMTR